MGMGKKHRDILLLTPIVAALAAAAAVFPGCFAGQNSQANRPAPVVDAGGPGAEHAYWRGKYVKNRMVPPEQYSVLPAPARNNDFGEFDDSLYGSLDRQPTLPPLPGDVAVMPAVGGPETYAMAASSYPGAQTGGSLFTPTTRAPAGPSGHAAAQSAASAPQGIVSGNRFYPVEQLVYGGAHGELDSPGVYRLMPRDVISVTVRDHPEFSGQLTLQPDGTVRVPNTPDPVPLRGMTADEAADALRRSLAVYVKGDCVVRVQANRARGVYYFVFGDVKQPGRFPMGLEPVRLSDAVMAANFETNPTHLDEDEELGPAFPAASPRGASVAPRTADLARVMLITPHRSQPVRTTHDLRQAMLGMTAGDPPVRPGQIIVVPSLDPEKNLSLGLEMAARPAVPEGLLPGQGFSGANSPARLPEVLPYADAAGGDVSGFAGDAGGRLSGVEENLRRAYGVQSTVEATEVRRFPEEEYAEYEEYAGDVVYDENGYEILPDEVVVSAEPVYSEAVLVESVNPVLPPPARGRRLRKAPFAAAPEVVVSSDSVDGWEKGF